MYITPIGYMNLNL